MKPITPMLWFNGQAEEAMNLYVSLFPDSKVLGVMRAPKGTRISLVARHERAGRAEGSVELL